MLVKAVATAIVVAAAGRLAARSGPFAAAVAMAIPMNAAPGFLLVILEGHDGPFVADAALASTAGCGAVLVYGALFVRFGHRLRLLSALLVAALGWLALALPIAFLPRSLPVAAALIAAGALVARVVWRRTPPPADRPASVASWRFLLLRGLVLGLTVTIVAKSAGAIGPIVAGLAFAFPLVITSTALVLDVAYGRVLALATVAAVPRTLWVYGAFVLTLHFAATRLGPLGAWLLACGLVVPAATAFTIVALRPGIRGRVAALRHAWASR